MSICDVAQWAIHPGGPEILRACQEALELRDDALSASHDELRNHGNMSSPTILFVLDELRRRGESGGYTVTLGFGPGLAVEAALLAQPT